MPQTFEFMPEPTLNKLRQMGLIKEGLLKKYLIRNEFWNGLKRQHGSYKAIEMLAQKYFLSPERVRNIVYEKKNR